MTSFRKVGDWTRYNSKNQTFERIRQELVDTVEEE